MTQSGKIPSQAGFEPGIFRSRGGHPTRPTRLEEKGGEEGEGGGKEEVEEEKEEEETKKEEEEERDEGDRKGKRGESRPVPRTRHEHQSPGRTRTTRRHPKHVRPLEMIPLEEQ